MATVQRIFIQAHAIDGDVALLVRLPHTVCTAITYACGVLVGFPRGATSVGHLLQALPSIEMGAFASAFTNFNSVEDLHGHRQKLLILHGEHALLQSM